MAWLGGRLEPENFAHAIHYSFVDQHRALLPRLVGSSVNEVEFVRRNAGARGGPLDLAWTVYGLQI